MLFISVTGNTDIPTCRDEVFCTSDSALPVSLCGTITEEDKEDKVAEIPSICDIFITEIESKSMETD